MNLTVKTCMVSSLADHCCVQLAVLGVWKGADSRNEFFARADCPASVLHRACSHQCLFSPSEIPITANSVSDETCLP